MAKHDSGQYWNQTWSPPVGCSHCSEGCLRCWAEAMARRHAGMGLLDAQVARWDGTIRLRRHMLDAPRHWRKPRIVLTCAMTDLFHETMPFTWQEEILAIAQACRRHQFVIPTKRPANAIAVLDGIGEDPNEFPQPNIWLGASICDQADAVRMLPSLCELAARGWNTFIHAEPVLGPIELDEAYDEWWASAHCPRWIVAGGETGPGARRCDVRWIIDLMLQCEGNGIPFWFKGWGRCIPPGQEYGKLDGKQCRQKPEGW